MPETPEVSTSTNAIEDILGQLPPRPGVYLMKDDKGKVIYVGKAVNLRSRVRSYFRESGDQRFSVKFLVGRVANIETVVTDTEKEALLLENVLIKKHQPRYNIRLRDDKTYISLRLDPTAEWPRLSRVRRRRAGDKAMYFGPFSSSKSVKETTRFLQKLFPIRSCPDQMLYNRSRPCILHQIGRCCAPCVGLVEKPQYTEYVEQTAMFLRGKKAEVLEILRNRMWALSEAMAYEQAAAVRDRVLAIEGTVEKELVVSHRAFDRDVIAFVRERGRMLVIVLTFRGGKLEAMSPFEFRDLGQPDEDVMEGFLSRYYEERTVPRDVLVNIATSNLELIMAGLVDGRGGPVRLTVPQRGEPLRLVEMARRNAQQELEKRLAGEKSRDQVIADLQSKLKLPTEPRRIECFDISNFQGSFMVGSMTCFVDGEPEKSGYRRFKIRTVEGQDDFASMREVLTRRYARALKEGTELPDLIVIDGGKGQLNSAVEVMKELGIFGKIPVIGLAKARLLSSKQGVRVQMRSEERVFMPNRKLPITFDQSDPALFILTRIRDEAHRFGITYHRKLRNTAALKSGLEEIPGVGPKKRKALLTHFGSLGGLRNAPAQEIEKVEGIPPDLAARIHKFLHPTDEAVAEPQNEEEWETDDDEQDPDVLPDHRE